MTPLAWARAKISVPWRGEQRLVGRDHVLAVVDRLQHELARHRVSPPISSTTMSMSGRATMSAASATSSMPSRETVRSLPRSRALAAFDDDVAAGAARDLLAVAAQHLDRAAAHRAEAEQADVDGLHENLIPVGAAEIFLSKWKDVMVIPSRK